LITFFAFFGFLTKRKPEFNTTFPIKYRDYSIPIKYRDYSISIRLAGHPKRLASISEKLIFFNIFFTPIVYITRSFESNENNYYKY